MLKNLSAWEYCLLMCAPIAIIALLAPILIMGYKFLKVGTGMREYEAKKICTSGFYSGYDYDGDSISYYCRGVIYGIVYLSGLPFGKEWRYHCVLELKLYNHNVVDKMFLPFGK